MLKSFGATLNSILVGIQFWILKNETKKNCFLHQEFFSVPMFQIKAFVGFMH